jgi:hypothetical protein
MVLGRDTLLSEHKSGTIRIVEHFGLNPKFSSACQERAGERGNGDQAMLGPCTPWRLMLP